MFIDGENVRMSAALSDLIKLADNQNQPAREIKDMIGLISCDQLADVVEATLVHFCNGPRASTDAIKLQKFETMIAHLSASTC